MLRCTSKKTMSLIAVALYPLIVMWPLLTSRRDSHLGIGLSDVDGAVQNATILKNVGLSLSGTRGFTAYPVGEEFWRVEMISQAISVIAYWVLVQIVRPMLAVNIFILIGWILSGLLVFLLARSFNASVSASAVCAISYQAIPSIREQTENYVSYVWVAIPLGLIYILLKSTSQKEIRRYILGAAYLSGVAFFDPYWFFFGAFILLVVLNFHLAVRFNTPFSFLRIPQRIAIFIGTTTSSMFLFGYGFSTLTNFIQPSGNSRRIVVASSKTVEESSSHLLNFIDPPTGHAFGNILQLGSKPILYVGVITLFLAIAGVVTSRKARNLSLLVLLTIALWSLSLKPQLSFLGVELALPSDYARRMMPGVQYVVRASFVSQALIFVLAAIGITNLVARIQKPVAKNTLVLLAGLICFIDVGGLRTNTYTSDSVGLSTIKNELKRDKESVVLALPQWKMGRSWHEQWILDVPFVNGTIENGILADVDRSAAAGPGSLASFRASKEITHVLAPRDFELTTVAASGPKTFKFQSPRFIEVADANTWGYEKSLIELVLYKVSPFPGDKPCNECLGYSQIITPPNMVRDGEQPYFWSTYMGGTLSAHIGGPLGIWKIQDKAQVVEITFGTQTTQVLEITDGFQKIKLQIPAGAIRTVQLKQDQARGISINPLKKCYSPQEMNPEVNDTRPLCFRIDSVRINLVEENHFELENR